MSGDRARPWPTKAAWARDDAVQSLAEAVRMLEPMVAGERQISEAEIIRRTARALVAVERAIRILAQAGAQVKID
ncbi:MAG TPA: hypothetical protein PKL11_06305 [Anaerolineaceae bacterium]|nr:hypothetical protein [Anaerolineaceae bacterium]HOG80103.1 hypothetical protein [Anaerolineaceae bacterium]